MGSLTIRYVGIVVDGVAVHHPVMADEILKTQNRICFRPPVHAIVVWMARDRTAAQPKELIGQGWEVALSRQESLEQVAAGIPCCTTIEGH